MDSLRDGEPIHPDYLIPNLKESIDPDSNKLEYWSLGEMYKCFECPKLTVGILVANLLSPHSYSSASSYVPKL